MVAICMKQAGRQRLPLQEGHKHAVRAGLQPEQASFLRDSKSGHHKAPTIVTTL